MAPFLSITSPENIGWRKRRHGGRLMAMDDFVQIAQATCFQLLWIRRIGSWLVEIRISYSGHILQNRLVKEGESAIKEFLDIILKADVFIKGKQNKKIYTERIYVHIQDLLNADH